MSRPGSRGRERLIELLYESGVCVYKDQARELVDLVLAGIVKLSREDGRLELRRFGVFRLGTTRGGKETIRFRASGCIRRRVDTVSNRRKEPRA